MSETVADKCTNTPPRCKHPPSSSTETNTIDESSTTSSPIILLREFESDSDFPPLPTNALHSLNRGMTKATTNSIVSDRTRSVNPTQPIGESPSRDINAILNARI